MGGVSSEIAGSLGLTTPFVFFNTNFLRAWLLTSQKNHTVLPLSTGCPISMFTSKVRRTATRSRQCTGTSSADECKAKKYTKALIVEDIVANGTVADAYQLSSDLPHMGYLGIKVAFVDKYLEQQELNLFGELTAVNRGINAKVFNDISEAEKWLLGG